MKHWTTHCGNTVSFPIVEKKQVFEMTLISRHFTAFSCQMDEAILITEGKRDLCLNSKAEWNGIKIPRLVIEVYDKVKQVDLNGAPLIHQGSQPNQSNKSKRPRTNMYCAQKDLTKRSRIEPEPEPAPAQEIETTTTPTVLSSIIFTNYSPAIFS